MGVAPLCWGVGRRLPHSSRCLCRFREVAAPRVQALLHKLSGGGCELASPPVVCEDIFEGVPAVGAFDHQRRVVVMNPAVPAAAMHQREWTRTITHELVHAFDACRVRLDAADCSHIACTEIRAANLSGDCDFGAEVGRLKWGVLPLTGHQQVCVRRRAELSARMASACAHLTPAQVADTVDRVWKPCYSDTAPFPTN